MTVVVHFLAPYMSLTPCPQTPITRTAAPQMHLCFQGLGPTLPMTLTSGWPIIRALLTIVVCTLAISGSSSIALAQTQTNIATTKPTDRKAITLRPVVNNAFGRGERISYRVHYGWFTAGQAVMQVNDDTYNINNRRCYRIEVTGVSSGLVKQITTIRDVWGAFVDTAAIMPHKFYRNIKENNYSKNEEIAFDYPAGRATVTSSSPPVGEVTLQPNTLDMITGYYYLRLLDYNNLAPETMITLTGIYENQTYIFRIRYKGKERIKTPLGYINCIKLQPLMPENGVFAGENSVKFYISDDDNRIPLKIRAELFVGAVELDIESYQNVKHPLIFGKR